MMMMMCVRKDVSVSEKDDITILWDTPIQTHKLIKEWALLYCGGGDLKYICLDL